MRRRLSDQRVSPFPHCGFAASSVQKLQLADEKLADLLPIPIIRSSRAKVDIYRKRVRALASDSVGSYQIASMRNATALSRRSRDA